MKSIALVSHSGSIGKTTLSSAIAIEASRAGWATSIADVDPYNSDRALAGWHATRNALDVQPSFKLCPSSSSEEALSQPSDEDLFVFDCPSRATQATLLIAQNVDFVIQPIQPGTKADAALPLQTFYAMHQAGVPLEKDDHRIFSVQHQSSSECNT